MQIDPITSAPPVRAPVRPAVPPEAAREFAAMLVTQMVEPMLATVPDIGGSGTAGEMWRSELAGALARQWVEGGQLGIADSLADTGR